MGADERRAAAARNTESGVGEGRRAIGARGGGNKGAAKGAGFWACVCGFDTNFPSRACCYRCALEKPARRTFGDFAAGAGTHGKGKGNGKGQQAAKAARRDRWANGPPAGSGAAANAQPSASEGQAAKPPAVREFLASYIRAHPEDAQSQFVTELEAKAAAQ